jgi:hypothetical protein
MGDGAGSGGSGVSGSGSGGAMQGERGSGARSSQGSERSSQGGSARDAQGSEGRGQTTGQSGREQRSGTTGQGGAQERNQMGRDQDRERAGQDRERMSQDREGRSGASTSGSSANLTSEQRTRIHQTIVRQGNAPRVSNVNFSVSVGTTVPRSVRLVSVPSTIVEIYPAWRGYEYFMVGDQVVIVDPDTMQIVAVISS